MLMWSILSLAFLSIIIFRYRRRRLYKLVSKIPVSNEELPIIGLAHKLSGNTEDIMTNLKLLSYETMGKNGLCRGWLGHILCIMILNPVDAEYVLKTCLEKDGLSSFMRSLLGNATPFGPVSVWRRRRKHLNRAFSQKNLESFIEIFSKRSQIFVSRLAKISDSSCKFNMWPFVSSYTLDSVQEATMDVSMDEQTGSESPFHKSLAELFNIICERICHIWLHPEWMFKFSPQYSRHQRCIQTLNEFTDEVIKKKLQDHKRTDYNGDPGNHQRKTFLDLLINSSGDELSYTVVELKEEVLNLHVAGNETSALAICFTLMLLAKYPKIQEKVYEEIQEVFGDTNRPLVKEDLKSLKYLERVVKESLRLFPPVPLILRKNETEITLPSGYTLPAGSSLAFPIWGFHHDPKYWGSDTEHFDPDRFLPERFNLKHPCSYMPFSYGPRNCIGFQYAMFSLKTLLATVIRSYKIIGEPATGPIPNIRVKIEITLKAVDDYWVKIEKRKPYREMIS